MSNRQIVCGHNTKRMIQSVKGKGHCEIGKVFVDITQKRTIQSVKGKGHCE